MYLCQQSGIIVLHSFEDYNVSLHLEATVDLNNAKTVAEAFYLK